MKTANEIIQEAMEIAYLEYPKTFLDRLFHREPPESKLKSSSIWHLTQRLQESWKDKEVAEKRAYEVERVAKRMLALYNADMEFHKAIASL